jgi:opacity protein-like surface antigen
MIFRTAVVGFALSALASVSAHAQTSRASQRDNGPAVWNWSGLYLGAHVGAGFGSSEVANPYGASIYGDTIRLPNAFAGLQGGYNWQAVGSPWVLGLEVEASAVDADGTNTCLAYSGNFVSANCRTRQHAMGSITGRIGHAFGPQGRSLAYIKGGAAFMAGDRSITTNAEDYLNQPSNESSGTGWGWTAGVGIEHALAPAWSIKAEYAYADFGRHGILAPGGGMLTTPFDANTLVNTAGAPTRVHQQAHLIKLGLNYHLGRSSGALGEGWTLPARADKPWPGWQLDAGVRYWYSHGRYQNDLSLTLNMAQQNHLVSRLTYVSEGHSGEVFWRLNSPRAFFLKGFAGGGGLTSGHMNDEDWFPTDPDSPMSYSNTYHGKVTGMIAYATLDAGVDLFSDGGNKIGVFAGYNFYRDQKDSFGCVQTAFPDPRSICGRADPTTKIAISQREDWHSLRLGVNGTLAIAPGVKLGLDAAYVPYAHVSALDIHHQRTEMPSPRSPAWGTGRGVQLEAILTYDVTPQFSVGVGGRYWAMWATDVVTAGFGSPTPDQALPIRVERYGSFLQASYKLAPF